MIASFELSYVFRAFTNSGHKQPQLIAGDIYKVNRDRATEKGCGTVLNVDVDKLSAWK